MAAQGGTLPDALDAEIGILKGDVHEANLKSPGFGLLHESENARACQCSLDGEIDSFCKTLAALFERKTARGQSHAGGIVSRNPGCDRIWVGPAITVRTGKLRCRGRYFADHFVVLFAGCVRDKANLESPAVWLFHDVESRLRVFVEHRHSR